MISEVAVGVWVVMGEVFGLNEALLGVLQGVIEVEYNAHLPHSLPPHVKVQVWGLLVEEFPMFAKTYAHHPEVECKKLTTV